MQLLKGGSVKDAADWGMCRKLVDQDFLHSLKDFDVENAVKGKHLGKKRVAGVETLLQKTGGQQAAERASIVALAMFKWCMGCLSVYRALVQMAAMRKEMNELAKTNAAAADLLAKSKLEDQPGIEEHDEEISHEEDPKTLVAAHARQERAARTIQRGARSSYGSTKS